jgi:hypothetical protein
MTKRAVAFVAGVLAVTASVAGAQDTGIPDGAACKAFSAPHTSYVVVISKSGKVMYTGVGGKQDIEAALASAQ